MKRTNLIIILGLIIIPLLLHSCSDINKAHKAIKEELRLTLHDFKSYEPVSFGKVEVATSTYVDLPDFKNSLDDADMYLKLCEEYRDKMDIYDFDFTRDKYWYYSGLRSNSLAQANASLARADSLKLHFVAEQIGWKIRHTFRAKNLSGNLGIHHYEYYFDSDFEKVIKTIDLSDSEN